MTRITADFNNEECVLTLTREKKAVAYFIAEQRRGLYILKGRLANPPTDGITLLSHSQMKDLVYTFHNSQNHMPLRHSENLLSKSWGKSLVVMNSFNLSKTLSYHRALNFNRNSLAVKLLDLKRAVLSMCSDLFLQRFEP